LKKFIQDYNKKSKSRRKKDNPLLKPYSNYLKMLVSRLIRILEFDLSYIIKIT